MKNMEKKKFVINWETLKKDWHFAKNGPKTIVSMRGKTIRNTFFNRVLKMAKLGSYVTHKFR